MHYISRQYTSISRRCTIVAIAVIFFVSTSLLNNSISNDLHSINDKNHPIIRVNITNEDIYRSYRERLGNLRRRTIHTAKQPGATMTSTRTDDHFTPFIENKSDLQLGQNFYKVGTSDTAYKVAVIEIYVGRSLPVWFRSFALSAEMSDPLLKWLIFVTEAFEIDSSFRNVEIIRLSRQELYSRLSRLDYFEDNVKYFGNLIEHAPYALVEFKPCLGIVFSVRLNRAICSNI